ncbi:hypothetical protein [Dactylosporangium fulvum]|uniref:Uncharacterized protein n=1 Tax=Dactylosporangium fulvum TaxID=53359 RepID=A0ABY5VTT9_9ACTN|nr:hypothetical protein [Dactylosporangium fulvum]UWP79903.1 hypothetical protein Dfulv_32690 [Dactylosporangium fulvum]
MDDAKAPHRGADPTEDRRQALLAFLNAGLPSPASTATMVTALADARRAVAAHQPRGLPLDDWLTGQIRLRGIRENAAVLAMLELPERRHQTAETYRHDHPDRSAVLDRLLTILDSDSYRS